MREIREEIEIDAPSEQVWAVLIDLARYQEWNPFAIRAQGVPLPGQRLKVRITPPGRRGLTFRPKVTEYVAGRTFRWLGHLLVPGLLDGEHIHEIEPVADGRTRYIQRERFRGVLVPLFGGMLDDTGRGFRAMNGALKARVEGSRALVSGRASERLSEAS